KTHFAIERMLTHRTGMIGLPLRLLAREVYETISSRVGRDAVALVTGEERIMPHGARYWVATAEAMPLHLPVDFMAIDEIQTATDLERGHVFTDRILHARGKHETLLLGAATMAPMVRALLPGIEIIERPRLSQLLYAGSKKITRLPARSAIVAFSAREVYAIAELVRRERGGAAIVMGALSPRTRNAQVELYQNGEVDFLVATDAIGMGLNLDIAHVAFSSDTKFDGRQTRPLTPAEMAQIAGRAGRHITNGTFGVTGHAALLDDEMVARLQNHEFEPVRLLQWRNTRLDFTSPITLARSLDQPPPAHREPASGNVRKNRLARVPAVLDQRILETLIKNGTADLADTEGLTRLLWECCQIPDFREISLSQHVDIITAIFTDLRLKGTISQDWIEEQVRFCDNVDGDIDTLSNRIKQIRTWTFVANRKNWLDNPLDWRDKTREIENALSDALHERLTRRFVDRRTSVLIRHLRDKSMTNPQINEKSEVHLEGHLIGSIEGFRFTLAKSEGSGDAKGLRASANSAVAPEIRNRAIRLAAAPNDQIVLSSDGFLRWKGEIIAELGEGDDLFSPRIIVLADESLEGADLENVQERLQMWLRHAINTQLGQVLALREPADIEGTARGIVFQLSENFGILPRRLVAEDVRGLDQEVRGKMRRLGIRFGAYHLYLPLSLKPAPRELALILFALKNGGLRQPGVTDIPAIVLSGRTSFEIDPEVNPALYEVAGFKVANKRAVRVDILERLADIIRPLVAFDTSRAQGGQETKGSDETKGKTPQGAAERNGFRVTVEMTSLLGCAGEDFSSILKSLGYRVKRTPIEDKSSDTDEKTQSLPADTDLAADLEDAAKLDGNEKPDESLTGSRENIAALAKLDGADIRDIAAATGKETDTEEIGGKRPAPPAEADASAGKNEPEAESGKEVEPRFDEVWFPASRRPANAWQGKRPRTERDGKAPPQKEGKPKARDRHRRGEKRPDKPQGKATGQPRQKPREKPLDPDSPFAALAALKQNMPKK
ncbi:MAG TPA: helicase, partial [Devosia sp.]|nr:helicase [Devosia sp.]